jgi:hypothetical protein
VELSQEIGRIVSEGNPITHMSLDEERELELELDSLTANMALLGTMGAPVLNSYGMGEPVSLDALPAVPIAPLSASASEVGGVAPLQQQRQAHVA